MTYQEVLEAARTCSGPYCKVCPVCNGRACKNAVPGPGSKGSGTVAARNYDAWQSLCLNMDTICEGGPVDTSFTLFGQKYDLPVFAGPVGAVKMHYGDKFTDEEYNAILVPACAKAGIAAFTGDGTNPTVFTAAAKAIGENEGKGIPTVKPWDKETVFAKLDIRTSNAQAKVINLTTNITSLTIFLLNGQTVISLGLAAAACNMAGNYVGSSLAMKQSSKVTRPVIIFVLILLFLKVLGVI